MWTMSTASKVAAHKARYPGKYCLVPSCLWRTDELLCPRHCSKREVPYKAQARRIAEMYNRLATAEHRPDLED